MARWALSRHFALKFIYLKLPAVLVKFIKLKLSPWFLFNLFFQLTLIIWEVGDRGCVLEEHWFVYLVCIVFLWRQSTASVIFVRQSHQSALFLASSFPLPRGDQAAFILFSSLLALSEELFFWGISFMSLVIWGLRSWPCWFPAPMNWARD